MSCAGPWQARSPSLQTRSAASRFWATPSSVTWTADSVPSADHDIKPVDDGGGELWVEVKSTTGRDGQFSWPVAEFRLAVRARRRYVLYRVYEAGTTTPSCRAIRDPIGHFDTGELQLDLERLSGDVGPAVEAPNPRGRTEAIEKPVAGHDTRPSSEPVNEQP